MPGASTPEQEVDKATVTPGQVTGKALIESDRVEGTTVYDGNGTSIGTIKRLMIDKLSGKVAYAVMNLAAFSAWVRKSLRFRGASSITTRASAGIARVNEQQLKAAPTFYRTADYDWSDRQKESDLHSYWNMPPYWGGP